MDLNGMQSFSEMRSEDTKASLKFLQEGGGNDPEAAKNGGKRMRQEDANSDSSSHRVDV